MLERLLRENENRKKTPEQQIREGMTWEKVEKAKGRHGGDRRGEEFSSVKIFTLENGRVLDIIARRVDLGSGVTYEKGKAVVERIDEELARDDIFHYGDILRTALNEQSITAASNTLGNIVKAEEKARKKAEEEAEHLRQEQELARQRYLLCTRYARHAPLVRRRDEASIQAQSSSERPRSASPALRHSHQYRLSVNPTSNSSNT